MRFKGERCIFALSLAAFIIIPPALLVISPGSRSISLGNMGRKNTNVISVPKCMLCFRIGRLIPGLVALGSTSVIVALPSPGNLIHQPIVIPPSIYYIRTFIFSHLRLINIPTNCCNFWMPNTLTLKS